MNRLLHPPVFQGSLRRKAYFEGWYIKCLCDDLQSSIAFIPGVSLHEGDRHAFIQVNTSQGETEYIRFPVEAFTFSRTAFDAAIDANRFSADGIRLSVDRPGLSLHGELSFSDMHPYPSRFLAPGIMGAFTFIPFMECYHGVVSMSHRIRGKISFNGRDYVFEKGVGYIEKDWGSSFPESWVWMQANPFRNSEASFMLSVAKIPWMGLRFTGLIGFLYHDGRLERFGTYLGHKVIRMEADKETLRLALENRKHRLSVTARQGQGGKLTAPVRGKMERSMKESLNADLEIELRDPHGKILFSGTSHIAGFEASGDIGDLLPKRP
ncbi:MAG: hypothetical protein JXR21_00770 [Candidatus Marinimicrobia bacterium]|nr:hypothetical protein [Candidatus Neomarinimicrobiota bacterium]